MSDYSNHAHDAYLERLAHVVARFRDMADRIERVGQVEDHGGVMPSYAGDPHVHAAQKVVHEVVWGVANSGLDTLVSDAGMADRATREEQA